MVFSNSSSGAASAWPEVTSAPQMSRSLASARPLATSTVMPRPTAAGVLGIARTTGVVSPNTFSKPAMRQPAAIESAAAPFAAKPL